MEIFKNPANCITSLRIVGTVGMLFTVPFSKIFYVLYTFSGITDILDGAVARATGMASSLGAKLDSIADLLFYTVMMVKILPYLWEVLPVEIWYFVGAIVLARVITYSISAKKYKQFASMHTYANKLTGLAVFSIPYYIIFESVALGGSIAVCIIAVLAAIEEMLLHLSNDGYDPGRKSILMKQTLK